jgi:hypothetical protein
VGPKDAGYWVRTSVFNQRSVCTIDLENEIPRNKLIKTCYLDVVFSAEN